MPRMWSGVVSWLCSWKWSWFLSQGQVIVEGAWISYLYVSHHIFFDWYWMGLTEHSHVFETFGRHFWPDFVQILVQPSAFDIFVPFTNVKGGAESRSFVGTRKKESTSPGRLKLLHWAYGKARLGAIQGMVWSLSSLWFNNQPLQASLYLAGRFSSDSVWVFSVLCWKCAQREIRLEPFGIEHWFKKASNLVES